MSGQAADEPFKVWLPRTQGEIESALEQALTAANIFVDPLANAMRHGLLLGGKRLRPAITCAACEALGGLPQAGLAAGVALELVHAYSLIHDDLPAMDNDMLRRGQPTVHLAFDEATAILAGDALLTLAFEHLSTVPALASVGATGRLAMIAALARAAGPAGMVAGQALDLAATGQQVDEPELVRIHSYKTSTLITAALVLGGLAAGCDQQGPEMATLTRFGEHLGLAYQIIDDLLDATGTSATLGKTANADRMQRKSTYVSLLGVDATRARAQTVCAQALTCLDSLATPGHLPDFVHWARDRDY